MTSKLSRLSGIKKAQGIAGATSGGRLAEKKREQEIAERLNEMTPRTKLDVLVDEMRRLLYTLVKDGGWTEEDVATLTALDDESAAKAMIVTLHGALERQGLIPLEQEDWIALKVAMATEEERKKQSELRFANKNAAKKHMLAMVGDMKIHEGELEWAAEMMDIIPAEQREDVRRQWAAAYEDMSSGMESDRYRNANLTLLNAAMHANPDKFKEASERKRPRK